MADILVTGSTGYIGKRLISELIEKDYDVRCLARHPEDLEEESWFEKVAVVQGDVLKPTSLNDAFKDIKTLYYLIHSMGGSSDKFEERDRKAALNVADLAKQAGVEHIIYMSALGDENQEISDHLKSRQETAKHLASTGVALSELRAAIVVGSGSSSFEMIRYLTERLPILPMPIWADSKVQPIAIDDVISYLIEAKSRKPNGHSIMEIGGSDVLSYKKLMLNYAKARALKRFCLPLPFFPVKLAAYFVHLITPIPASVAEPLLKGLGSEAIVLKPETTTLFSVKPMAYQEALKKALDRKEEGAVGTLWSQSFYDVDPDSLEPDSVQDKEGLLFDTQVIQLNLAPSDVYKAVLSIGGDNGWSAYNWLWKLRGLMDRVLGGVGMRPGRRNPKSLRVGDVLDFWRVESLKENEFLQLKAEMKLPGKGWLRFDIDEKENITELKQTAYYEPKGLLGYLYWWAVYPFHLLIFPSMIKAIAKRSQEISSAAT